MASSIMKSVLIFITMLLQLISCSSGVWIPNASSVKGAMKGVRVMEGGAEGGNDVRGGAEAIGKDRNAEVGNTGRETPQTTRETTMNFDPKLFGETLAKKYFGNEYIKGFRWGYRLEKRIHSVAQKCEDFLQALNDSSCPQLNQPSPFPNSDTVNCIVEAVALDGTCLKAYEKEQYPPEATCELDNPDTLNSNYCVPSGEFTIHLGWACAHHPSHITCVCLVVCWFWFWFCNYGDVVTVVM